MPRLQPTPRKRACEKTLLRIESVLPALREIRDSALNDGVYMNGYDAILEAIRQMRIAEKVYTENPIL